VDNGEWEQRGAGHTPVLLQEVISGLALQPGGIYIDGTFGRGGHSRGILAGLGPEGRLLAMDRDPQAAGEAMLLARSDPRFHFQRGLYSDMDSYASAEGVAGRVNGVLLDLGVSSPQLDSAERGFSFQHDGPLDMRMDPDAGVPAWKWLQTTSEADMARVFKRYGEERYARRIAHAIAVARAQAPLTRTRQLAGIIARAHPAWQQGVHPATRCFQAIRIFLNKELEHIEPALNAALRVLAPGGRLLVISFHSLEDRIVKRFLRRQARGDDFPPDLPVTAAELHPRLRLLGRAVRPGAAELTANPRARSAVLRMAERLPC